MKYTIMVKIEEGSFHKEPEYIYSINMHEWVIRYLFYVVKVLKTVEDPGFQILCHQDPHFDHIPLSITFSGISVPSPISLAHRYNISLRRLLIPLGGMGSPTTTALIKVLNDRTNHAICVCELVWSKLRTDHLQKFPQIRSDR